MHIGKPIQTTGLKTDALNQLVENWIETEMEILTAR
jgi:1-acyl-sn-glycerol-3-phosphate acyltransferase